MPPRAPHFRRSSTSHSARLCQRNTVQGHPCHAEKQVLSVEAHDAPSLPRPVRWVPRSRRGSSHASAWFAEARTQLKRDTLGGRGAKPFVGCESKELWLGSHPNKLCSGARRCSLACFLPYPRRWLSERSAPQTIWRADSTRTMCVQNGSRLRASTPVDI